MSSSTKELFYLEREMDNEFYMSNSEYAIIGSIGYKSVERSH